MILFPCPLFFIPICYIWRHTHFFLFSKFVLAVFKQKNVQNSGEGAKAREVRQNDDAVTAFWHHEYSDVSEWDQLSFKIRKKTLTISSVPLIFMLPFLAMFSVMQVFQSFCKNAETFILAELPNTQPFSSTSFSDILPGYAHYHHSNWNPSFTQFYMCLPFLSSFLLLLRKNL